jgi:hypothetical protein
MGLRRQTLGKGKYAERRTVPSNFLRIIQANRISGHGKSVLIGIKRFIWSSKYIFILSLKLA